MFSFDETRLASGINLRTERNPEEAVQLSGSTHGQTHVVFHWALPEPFLQ